MNDSIELQNNTTNETIKRFALTTIDNPFNPFDDFTSWFMFDIEKGYNCSEKVAKIAKTSEQFTEKENCEEIEKAIDEIIQYDFLDVYKKVEGEVQL